MTNKRLQTIAKKWITKLELGAPLWSKITVRFATEKELGSDIGSVSWTIDYAEAEVLILAESEINDAKMIEETLIHELLHLRFEGHKVCDSVREPHVERALNVLAKILIAKK